MATTEGRMRSGTPEATDVERLEELWRRPARRPRRRVDLTRVLLVAWIGVVVAVLILESRLPAPEATALWSELVVLAFWAAFVAAVAGLAAKRTWSLRASAGAAAIGLVVAGLCGVTDHHPATLWGFEAGAFTALAGLTAVAARRS